MMSSSNGGEDPANILSKNFFNGHPYLDPLIQLQSVIGNNPMLGMKFGEFPVSNNSANPILFNGVLGSPNLAEQQHRPSPEVPTSTTVPSSIPQYTTDDDITGEMYRCHLCSYTGTSKYHFNAHMNTHFDHKCPFCDYTSRTEGRLKRHIRDFHSEVPPDSWAGSRVQRHDNGSLSDNSHSDGGSQDTNEPGSSGKPRKYKCKQCNFVALCKNDFWEHSKAHIKSEKMLTCPKCSFVTEYKHHLEYHLRNHFNSKPFKCGKCNYSCVNKSMLNSHMKSHSNIYQYRCSDCSYATKYCHSLKLHLRKYQHKPAMVLNLDGTPNPYPIIDVYGTRRGPRPKKKKDSEKLCMTPLGPGNMANDMSLVDTMLHSKHDLSPSMKMDNSPRAALEPPKQRDAMMPMSKPATDSHVLPPNAINELSMNYLQSSMALPYPGILANQLIHQLLDPLMKLKSFIESNSLASGVNSSQTSATPIPALPTTTLNEIETDETENYEEEDDIDADTESDDGEPQDQPIDLTLNNKCDD